MTDRRVATVTSPDRRELPSGRQYAISHGDQVAVVTEVGAGVRTYRVGDLDVLDPFAEDAICDGAHGQSLLPWPNRVKDGQYSFAGRDYQLDLTEPKRHNAIHGLARWCNWELIEHVPAAVQMAYRLAPQQGWPFILLLELRYSLGSGGLLVETSITNVGLQLAPAAAGAHPYLSAGGGVLDDCTLLVPGSTFIPVDERGIPTGRPSVEGSDHDFRTGRLIGDQHIDEAFGDVTRDADGRAVVRLTEADGTARELWAGEGYHYLQIYTGDTLAPERQRRGIGVEPMTAPPNGLQTGEDLILLEPSQHADLQWGVRLG